jgi:ornithine carbamoyltransferase
MDLHDYKPKGAIPHGHLLSLTDYSAADIYEILHLAGRLKILHKKGKRQDFLRGKTLAMIFAKASTRTRVSFEQGIKQLGGSALFLSSADIQLGRGETVADTAKTLSRFGIDGVMIRTFRQEDVEALAEAGDFPVINGLTDRCHPCQALADILTVYEVFGRLTGVKLAYFGDGNNVAHSLMTAGAKVGMEIVCCCPKGYAPDPEVTEAAKRFGSVTVTDDVDAAIKGANAVYTDVFFSMGQAPDEVKRAALDPYRVTARLMERAAADAIFLHCLPAHRGEEVDAEVIDGCQSRVFDEAENRLHVQKAVMVLLMK